MGSAENLQAAIVGLKPAIWVGHTRERHTVFLAIPLEQPAPELACIELHRVVLVVVESGAMGPEAPTTMQAMAPAQTCRAMPDVPADADTSRSTCAPIKILLQTTQHGHPAYGIKAGLFKENRLLTSDSLSTGITALPAFSSCLT